MKFNVIDQILCDFQKDVRELLLLRLFSFLNKKIKMCALLACRSAQYRNRDVQCRVVRNAQHRETDGGSAVFHAQVWCVFEEMNNKIVY